MAGTPNPSAGVSFGNGNSGIRPDTADNVMLMLGCASGGPLLKPRRASTLSSVLKFLHGPLVRDASHHVSFSQPCYVMRCRASILGTMSSVTKTPAAQSLGTVTLGLTTLALRAQWISNGSPLNLLSGWAVPPSPLPLKITLGSGGANPLNATVKYLDEAGIPRTEVLAFTGAGNKTTAGLVAATTSVTSDVDPVGTVDFSVAYSGPQDRYPGAIWRFTLGGQLSGGSAQPQGQWSMDGGRTWGRTQNVPTSGLVDLYTYAGGLAPQATGMRLTFSSAAASVSEFGSVRLAGADANGDTVWTALKAGATIRIVVAGNSTPLSVATASDAVTINAATSSGGAVTSTAAQILAFFNTDTGAGTIAARQRFRARVAVGTGASLVAAVAATGTTNGDVAWTAKEEGVQITVLESGTAQAIRLQVIGEGVTVYLDTDANGVRTTTAAAIVAFVAADPVASTMLSGVAGGTGAALAGDTAGPLALPVQFSEGDQFSWSTTPPQPSNADIAEALVVLEARQDVMDNISAIRLIKDGADSVDFDTFHAALDAMGNDKKEFLFGIMSAPYMADAPYNDNPNLWVPAMSAIYPNRGTKVSIVAGEVDTQVPAYGAEMRLNFAALYCARVMNVPLSQFASHVECDTLTGTQYSLPGVGAHLIPGGDPDRPEFASLWQTEDDLVQVHSLNMVTARSWPKLAGVFVRQSVQYTVDGDDWIWLPFRRVGNTAAALSYIQTLRIINADLLVDPQTGKLAEVEHKKIENSVKSYVGGKLLDDNGRQHVSAFEVVSERDIDFAATGAVLLYLNFVGKSPALTVTTQINVVKTLTSSGTPSGVA